MAQQTPSNPFDGFDNFSSVADPTQQQHQQPPPQHQQQQWAHQQQQQQQQQQMSPQQQQPVAGGNPFAAATTAPPSIAQAPNNNTNANPYFASQVAVQQQPGLGYVQPQQQQQQPPLQLQQHPHQQVQQQPYNNQQHQQQQLVPMAPNAVVASPWAIQQQPPVASTPQPAVQPYDPLGIFGSSTTTQQQTQQQQVTHQGQQQQHPYNNYAMPPPQQQQPAAQPLGFNREEAQNKSLLPDEDEEEGLGLIDVELDEDDDAKENLDDRKKDGEFLEADSMKKKKESKSSNGRKNGGSSTGQSWDRNPHLAPPPPPTPGRHHAEYLAQKSAPAMASPLPRYDLVHHSGYVLSRISFRTVLLRKWKQTFWIQYGPTQLLFFRTYADYVDWLNNPYHTTKAREFLIKLRVDFVSDLKKSSVMGYQVTQIRRKPYGRNVMLHFKLERWMDYGPTIAAAFAAREEEMMNSPTHRRNGTADDEDGMMNTTNDVTALRKIILGGMRNARDAALVASQGQQRDMGNVSGEYRGRYNESDYHQQQQQQQQNQTRIPSGPRNMGYHQAFSAESSERRRMTPGEIETESSQDEAETTNATHSAAAPVVDLLG